MNDLNVDEAVIRSIFLTIMGLTALSTLSFPLFFSRYQWRKTPVGRALMVKSGSTAAATTLVFFMQLWNPPMIIRLGVYAFCFSIIAISSARLTVTMLRINNADRMIPRNQQKEGATK